MKKSSLWKLLIAAIIYLALFILGSSCGLIHPVCYAYAGTFLPLFFAFVYFYCASIWQRFGAAAILNGFVLVIGLIAGEGNQTLIVGLIVLTVLAELVRKIFGYDAVKGVRLSFLPFAFSFYAYSGHWWTEPEATLAAAAEEMPAGYADKVEAVIHNVPLLIVMLVLTVPVAIFAVRLSEKAMKKPAAALK